MKLHSIIFSMVKYCTLYGGGSGGGGSSVTKQEIPTELKPLAKAYASKAMKLGDTKYTPYSGQRYADLNQTQNSALDLIQQRAQGGSGTISNAESNLNEMISGDATNPYLDQSVNRALDAVRGQVNSQFGGDGYGTTAHQETLATALGDTANNMYSGNYQSDQNRRLSAINAAPTFGNQAYTDASQLLNAGQIQQDQEQQGYDYGYQNYQDAQNLPYKQLAAMSGVFGSNLGSSSTTSQSSGGK